MFLRSQSTHLFLAAAIALQPLSSIAADPALKLSASFDLTTNEKGETFFELMSKKGGVKSKLDADYAKTFKVIDIKTYNRNKSNFDHIEELERKSGGASKVENLLTSLKGQDIAVDKMWSKVVSKIPGRTAGALAPVIEILSGKGVLVTLDENNYTYSVGYAKGSNGKSKEQDALDRKSGRSYGASISRNSYDPSDRDYLWELSSYVAKSSDKEVENFYRAIFEMLIKTDSSRLKKVNKEGQLVIADFMAVYIAEIDRHLMTGLTMYEWENALTELTMLAAYSTHDDGKTFDPNAEVSNDSGRTVTESGKIKERDRMVAFFGVGTDGSGLDGKNKGRRHALTKAIVQALGKIDKEAVTRLAQLIGKSPKADLYDDVMEFINSYKTQEQVREMADPLIDAIVDFVMSTRANAAAISENVNITVK